MPAPEMPEDQNYIADEPYQRQDIAFVNNYLTYLPLSKTGVAIMFYAALF